ncbi:WXG100 family type VII secretion target [Streptosporangium sp. CA-115845]|uniref:WXG100 family type VII secretion target n=1 Tax=Streptosporangium sp. CA-115845 TaxID=3240071 RepID=UPI003D8F79CB
MLFTSDRALYLEALALSGMAAIVMPYARPISFAIGLLVSDPGEMRSAAARWNDTSPAGAAPASGSGDIARLRQELGQLVREIGANGQWTGVAYQTFSKNFTDFDKSLAQLERLRKGVGDTLDVSAEIYHVGAQVCMGIATTLTGLTGFVYWARRSGVYALSAEGMAMNIVAKLAHIVQKIVTAHTKGVWKITGIVSAVAVYYNQEAQRLPGVKAVTKKTPEFAQALNYDSSSGGLNVPPPKMPEVETPSMLPDFGW